MRLLLPGILVHHAIRKVTHQMAYSYSSLSTYNRCPKLYEYTYEGAVRPDDPGGVPTRFGQHMVDTPLTEWYRSGGTYRPPWDDLWDACAVTDDERVAKPNKVYTIATAKSLWQEYTSRFARDFDVYEVINVQTFVVPRPDLLDYGAKADVVFRHKETGAVIPHDFKSSRWDFILEAGYLNQQFLGQMWVWGATEHITTLLNPESGLVERMLTRITVDQLAQFERETMFRIASVKRSKYWGIWPREAPGACFKFGRWCVFQGVCYGVGSDEVRTS